MSIELHFDSAFVGLNATITSTTSPLTYTITTPTTTLPQLTTFTRNDLPAPFATIEWRGMSARLRAPGWGLPDVDLDEWLHKTRWWSPSREYEVKAGQFRWNDSVWLPDWIFKQTLTVRGGCWMLGWFGLTRVDDARVRRKAFTCYYQFRSTQRADNARRS